MMKTLVPLHLAAAAAIISAGPALADTQLRFLSNFLPAAKQYPVEMEALDALSANADLGISVSHNEYGALGLESADGLRLVRAGTFDVVTVQIGLASRDDAFVEGLDLIGVSTDMDALRDAVNAYRDALTARVEEKFDAKVLALWPYGSQVFFCNQEIGSVSDLKGLKIRSYTPSMSALLESLGAAPVTLAFPEVYPALQRNLLSCGVTSPSSGNTAKWPEVTTHQLPLSVSGGIQGYFANLTWWNALNDAQRAAVESGFRELEDGMWKQAIEINDDAIACNTGQDSCVDHERFSMTLVEVTEQDIALVKEVAEAVILPDWVRRCEASYPNCTRVWNETVGKERGLTARLP